MHVSLLIRFQTDELVSWAVFDRKGQVTDSEVNVPLNKVPTDNQQPLVLIPTIDTILTQVNIPSNKLQKIIQAVPYALEEQLIDDVENLHFAIGQPVSGTIPVVVIAKTCLDSYLQHLHVAGFKPTMLMPDVLAVPYFEDGWTVMYLDNIGLVRTGLKSGFAIELDNLIFILQTAIAENPPTQITVINHTIDDLQVLEIPLQTIESDIFNIENNLFNKVNTSFNLLQGIYRPQGNNWLRPWWLTIVLVMILGGLYVTKQVVEYRYLIQERATLNQQIAKIYQETFPEARRIVNPRVQMEQKLVALRNQQKGNEVFLFNLDKMAPILKAIPNLTLKRIDFRNKKFDLHLIVENFQVLEKLQSNLNKLDLKVKVKSAANYKKKVKGRLEISVTQ
ncbi:MAG: hypothetical protein KAG43_06075 [Candidatus Marithrix sp.]|nr:hypothetical protein [Candidatus Marithrix sp.]